MEQDRIINITEEPTQQRLRRHEQENNENRPYVMISVLDNIVTVRPRSLPYRLHTDISKHNKENIETYRL